MTNQKKRYFGFDLSGVCWGYRDIFRDIIEVLYQRGDIGDHRAEVTRKFFTALETSDSQLFDHVLKEFLSAMAGESAWIFDLPAVFEEVIEAGFELARTRLYYGITYFRLLGEGGFGGSPQQVHGLISGLRRLTAIDQELAFSFLKGYRTLSERLSPPEIDIYLGEGIRIFGNNRKSGCDFLAATLRSSEAVIQSLSHECRLSDVKPSLEKLLKALSGHAVEIGDLSRLDSDELIERGTWMVSLFRWLYLPEKIRFLPSREENRRWYLLQTVVTGGMLSFHSFPCIHGRPEYRSCADLVGSSIIRQNLFTVFEYVRILRKIAERWPGARRLIRFGVRSSVREDPMPAQRLFHDLMSRGTGRKGRRSNRLLRMLDSSLNLFDTASMLTAEVLESVRTDYPGIGRTCLPSLGFLPDFSYPAEVDSPPRDSLVADMKSKAAARRKEREGDDTQKVASPQEEASADGASESDEEQRPEEVIRACFVYDEWCQAENDYYPDYCQVFEKRPEKKASGEVAADVLAEAKRVRRIFEMIKPQVVRRRKYLADGESINEDLLLDYQVLRRKEPSPEVKFFEKPLLQKRNLAVLVLMDASGSTAEAVESRRIIDVEKSAALILGQGLAAMGDRFAICGFSGHGRENCLFLIYKDFADRWNRESHRRLLSAWPMNSTRIGAALRHAGYRLSLIEARQRLIILVTDGKPSDTAYDPATRYAQHDVRMACEENRRKGIVTFGISTQENSIADMEIMFPRRRFAILKDFRHLATVLPRLYIKMTV